MAADPATKWERKRLRARRLAQVRRRRLAAIGALGLGALAAYLLLWSSGGGPAGEPATPPGTTGSHTKAAAAKLVATRLPGRLPAPVSGESLAVLGDSVLAIGGLDGGGASTDHVWRLDPVTGNPAGSFGALSQPLHDTAAGVVSGRALVFGGGSASTTDVVQALSPGAAGRPVGHLPATLSDMAAVTAGSSAYVVGGYDGRTTSGSVLQTADGARFTKIAELPTPVRYAATAASGDTIYLLGGELADGSDTGLIQALDLTTRRARVVGKLPRPLSHGSAVILGGHIYLLGGRVVGVGGPPGDRIVSFDPASGRVAPAGRLPSAVTNAAAVTIGDHALLVGGLDGSGAALSSVFSLRLASG